jgi:RND family efflux transporter MFP subunit
MKNWLIVILLVGGGGWAAFKYKDAKPQSATADIASRPTTALVETRNIRFAVSAAGEIGPAEQVSVRPEINGRIETLPVDLGDRVKRGQVLFTLDDKELQNQRASSMTEIERAKLQSNQAERNFRRAEDLFKSNLISQELFENTRTEFELAKNSVERSQREIAILEERLTKTKISAPFDCTILTRPISMGQAVSGSGGFNSGTEVLTIADLSEMIINAHINQADVTRLSVGETVEVIVEAVAGLKVTGRVERIAPQATLKNNIKGFAVRILLKNVDERVRPGMTANIRIPVASADNVLAVPLAAVFTEKNPDTGDPERFVYVSKADTYERRPVQVGVSDFFFAEIQSGLQEGEVVLLEQPKEERGKVAQRMTGMGGGEARDSKPAATKGTNAPATKAPTTTAPPASR